MKLYFVYIFVFLVLGCYSTPDSSKVNIHLQVVKKENAGWMYQIYFDSTLIIQQDQVPGLDGNYKFKTRKDTESVGMLVVDKLIHNQRPNITYEELNELNISIEKYNKE